MRHASLDVEGLSLFKIIQWRAVKNPDGTTSVGWLYVFISNLKHKDAWSWNSDQLFLYRCSVSRTQLKVQFWRKEFRLFASISMYCTNLGCKNRDLGLAVWSFDVRENIPNGEMKRLRKWLNGFWVLCFGLNIYQLFIY